MDTPLSRGVLFLYNIKKTKLEIKIKIRQLLGILGDY